MNPQFDYDYENRIAADKELPVPSRVRDDYKNKVAELVCMADKEIPIPSRVRDRMDEYFRSRQVVSHVSNVLDFQMPRTGVELRLFGFPDNPVKVEKDRLVEWLNEAATEPCHCGSGFRYERCHGEEEIPAIVASLIHFYTQL
jgi:hypothetical protein